MITENIITISKHLNLNHNSKNNIVFGNFAGYNILISFFEDSAFNTISFPVNLSNKSDINNLKESLTTVKSQNDCITNIKYNNHSIEILFTLSKVDDSILNQFDNIITTVTTSLSNEGLQPCCESCGTEWSTSIYSINNSKIQICDNCASSLEKDIENSASVNKNSLKKISLGIIGALIGSLIGLAIWLIFSSFGITAAIAGFALSFFTFKGYQILSKSTTKTGFFICLLIIIIMVYVSEYLSIGILIYQSSPYSISIMDCISLIPDFLSYPDVYSEFTKNLGTGYLFTIIGSFFLFKDALSSVNSQKIYFEKVQIM